MKKILTTSGVAFWVDKEDFNRVSKYRWKFYDRYIETVMDGKTVKLSRFIMGAKDGEYVDHINGNRLKNTKCNLRIATHSENMQNRKVNKNQKLGHKGIQKLPSGNYRVRVQAFGKRFHCGTFPTLKEAVKCRERVAMRLHKEFYREK